MREGNELPKEKRTSSMMTDFARKVLLTSVGAIFMTEESVRKTLSDLKVPKDAIGGLVDSIRKQKDELLQAVMAEFGKFFSKIKVHEELQKALEGMEVQLHTKISFDKKSKKTKPSS